MGLFDDLLGDKKLGLGTGNSNYWNVEFIPCGVPPVDAILGGGAAVGRIFEMFGNSSSGKSLLLYKFLIENARRGGISILRESEGAFSADFYASLGGDPNNLILRPADTVEEVFDSVVEICKKKIKSKSTDNVLIAWDSLAATATKHLLKQGMDKVDMTKAKMLSQGFQLITSLLKDANVTFLVVNQTREAIGTNDSATVTPGGKALHFHASQTLELRFDGGSKSSLIRELPEDADDEEKDFQEIGRRIKCKVQKNKVGPPWRECKLSIYSVPGLQHPKFDDITTQMGIDITEALFDFYLTGYFFLPSGNRVVQVASQGWYQLDASIDPSNQKWRRGEWPTILESVPQLRTLCYSIPPELTVPPAGGTDAS